MTDQPARNAVYSELMWPKWNPTSESYGAGEEKTNALLDAHAAEVRAAVEPAPVDRRRTTWPAAVELQQAADTLRAVAPQIEGRLAGLADPVADWLDETANALSCLAPYRDNEPGYGMWETAVAVARKILGTVEQQSAADGAQQPDTEMQPATVMAAANCPYGEGPGDGSGCIKPAGHDGDHVVTSGVEVVSCSRAALRQSHIPHAWWPQPGMTTVHCPGVAPAATEEQTR